jgi:uncharacterized membrane protein YgcG
LPWLLLSGLGAAKIVVGVLRDRPVSILVVLCVIVTAIAIGLWALRPRRTRAGDRLIAARRASAARIRRAPRSHELSLALALGGLGVLSGTAYAQYQAARTPPTGDSGSSSSSDSSSSSEGGGSGCGGCGGGGGD